MISHCFNQKEQKKKKKKCILFRSQIGIIKSSDSKKKKKISNQTQQTMFFTITENEKRSAPYNSVASRSSQVRSVMNWSVSAHLLLDLSPSFSNQLYRRTFSMLVELMIWPFSIMNFVITEGNVVMWIQNISSRRGLFRNWVLFKENKWLKKGSKAK